MMPIINDQGLTLNSPWNTITFCVRTLLLVATSGLLLDGCGPSQSHDVAIGERAIGERVRSLRIETVNGDQFTLDDAADAEAIVLAWTGIGCPMAKIYLPRLRQLAVRFQDKNVRFFLINSNAQDSALEVGAIARMQSSNFSVVRDVGGRLAIESVQCERGASELEG